MSSLTFTVPALAAIVGSVVALVRDTRQQRRQVRLKPRGRWL